MNFSYRILIIGNPGGEYGIRVVCGGTLINQNYVLSAANCWDGGQKPTIVGLGEVDISTTNDGVKHEDVSIDRVIIHEA